MTDLAASLIVWLRPRVTDATVGGRVPRDRPTRFVLVRRIGGPWRRPMIDTPSIGVEAWAATQAQAHDLAQQVRSLVWSLQGGILNGVAIYRVEEFAGPAWLPDPTSGGDPRYVLTMSVWHREQLGVA
jgi:hypothetical protein